MKVLQTEIHKLMVKKRCYCVDYVFGNHTLFLYEATTVSLRMLDDHFNEYTLK